MSRIAAFLATTTLGILLVPVAALSGSSGSPTIYSPSPLAFSTAEYLLNQAGVPPHLAFLLGPVIFWLLATQQLQGSVTLSRATRPIAVSLVALVALHHILAYLSGSLFRPFVFVLTTGFANLLLFGLVFLLTERWRRHPSFVVALLANWLLVGWLFSYAFPYLGERL